MSFLKFRLLLWKNFLIQKGKPVATLFEIGLPTLFSLILMVLRLRVEVTPHHDITQWTQCPYQQLETEIAHLKLAYTPNNTVTQRIMERVKSTLNISIDGFPNEDDMVNFITLVNNTGTHHINNSAIYLGGIVFQSNFVNDSGQLRPDKQVVYKIRLSYAPRVTTGSGGKLSFKSDTAWSTNFMFPPYQIVGPREKGNNCNGDPGYAREGFLALQHAVDDALLKELLSDEQWQHYENVDIHLNRHPYPPYKEDNYVLVLQQQFPLVIMLSLLVNVLGIVRDIVLEKERKLKESMKMMGINNWLHWVAWFTKHFLFLFISIVIMTIFYCVELDSEKGAVIAETNPFIVFLYLLCYCIATITFCFAVCVFFARANVGAAIGGIMFFCMFIPYFFLQQRYSTLSFMSKIISCLDFQVAMAYGGTLLGMFEGVGSGIQLSTLASGVSVDDDFSMVMVFVMLLADSAIHILIAWYVEAVFPGEYGFAQPWYFPFLKSYWGCCPQTAEHVDVDEAGSIGQDPSMFEKEPSEVAGIKIRNLRKVYGKGRDKKVAVAGMTLNMYEGQITALLGHNGAGKTTTMSLLTGFYPPTSGTAFINGYDIRQEISEVRNSLGLCPQHDILFDNLTVEEHIIFFGLLKGVPKSNIIPQCEEMLKDMELFNKLKAKSKNLSGGMKRKLSVCIALIGNSKVVFLDEPSSGLDPKARRNIWTVLQKNRAGRTMVLSTHFMDEADHLGDRIAIMSEGVVKCCGSSLFLKKKYGAGYHMILVKRPECDVQKIINIVSKYIPTAELESNIGAELSFILPQNLVSNFEPLFTELEQKQEELGISSFGASVTTMEEVFLKVGQSDDVQERLQQKKTAKTSIPEKNSSFKVEDCRSPLLRNTYNSYGANASTLENSVPDNFNTDTLGSNSSVNVLLEYSQSSQSPLNLTKRYTKNTGLKLYFQQFWAMFVKRALHTLRNKLVTVTQLVIPVFFTVMGLVVLKTLPSFTDMPALKLVTDEFGENFVPYAYGNPAVKEMALSYARQFGMHSSSVTQSVNQERNDSNIVEYLAHKGVEGIGIYNLRYMVAASFNGSTYPKSSAVAYFNNQAYHSIAVSLSALFNGLLAYFTNSSGYSIETYNHPLPRLTINKIQDEGDGKDFTGFTLGFNLTFGMAFLASSFVLFLVKEKTVKAKHIQFVSGVHAVNFWLSTLCWDLINFMLPCLCLIITFFAFSITNFTVDLHWLQLIFFFFLYGWAMLPYMYLMSFGFTVPSTAYVWITMFNILTGVATLLVVVILSIPQIGLQDVSIVLEWIFLAVFPNFCLSEGVFQFYQNYQNLDICKPVYKADACPYFRFMNLTNPCCPDYCGDFCLYYNKNYFGWEKSGIGRMLTFLAIQGLFVWILIFLSEFGLLQKIWYRFSGGVSSSPTSVDPSQIFRDIVIQEDDDVARERARIKNSDFYRLLRSDKLVLDNLTKYYASFCAVDHLSVGIPAGECFGLLGINGAGKSSTFMMLTGDSKISSGQAYLDTYNLKTQRDLARKHLGYCPQFDALIDQLTGREILTLFARLRGIKESSIPEAVTNVMKALTLSQYADKQCQTYSGGNKRKLSTAIALIGDPDVVFLDEPTTGMDPVARRMLWEVLTEVRDSGRTLVLTSHSMEECEALCTRIAIMVNGQFKCLGSIQHLKNKFGEGFTFSAKIAYPPGGGDPDLGPLQEFMVQTFPDSKLNDVHDNMVNYHIQRTHYSWAQVFGIMERAKERLQMEDYLVSQTSLEQVFIYFASMQDNPEEH
ncbi:ATP-binding cassette sub-family A member 3 [Biomphalaria glabrata]|nr:ATP-binding cassette sub-family A member 3 [Biomphalaria glabrata]